MPTSLSPETHSDTLGGSSAPRRYHCAASYKLEKGLPSLPGSVAADMGTTLHEAVARCVKEGILAHDVLGWTCEQTGVAITWDMIENKLRPALKAFYALLDEHGIENVVLERAIDYNKVPGHAPLYGSDTDLGFGVPDAYGTVDVIGVNADKTAVLVADWKFGHYPVSADFNLQLAFYAYGAYFGEMSRSYGDVPTLVHVAIIQPDRMGECVPSVSSFTTRELRDIADVWTRNYASSADATPIKGDWCKWCKAKTMCPAHVPGYDAEQPVVVPAPEDDTNEITWHMNATGGEAPVFTDVHGVGQLPFVSSRFDWNTATPLPQQPGQKVGPVAFLESLPFDPTASNAKLGEMMVEWVEIRAWVSDRAAYLERLLFGKAEDGEETPGYKLVEKKNHRVWEDPEKAGEVLRDRIGDDNAMPRTLISPPQAEKHLGSQLYREEVAKYVSTRSAGIKLVPEDDSRDAVNVGDRFQEVGQMLQGLKEETS